MEKISEKFGKEIHKDGETYILRLVVRCMENKRVFLIYTTRWDMETSITYLNTDAEMETYMSDKLWDYGELLIKEYVHGEVIDMRKTPSFHSNEISKEEVLDELIKCTILKSANTENLYCEENTKRFIDDFQKNCMEVCGGRLLRYLPGSLSYLEIYELKLVSAEYRYYISLTGDMESGILMVSNKDDCILSDNYFAFDSMIKELDVKKESDFLFITEEMKEYIRQSKKEISFDTDIV